MAMDDLTLEHYKIIVLMVLWSRNQAVDCLHVENAVVAVALGEDQPAAERSSRLALEAGGDSNGLLPGDRRLGPFARSDRRGLVS